MKLYIFKNILQIKRFLHWQLFTFLTRSNRLRLPRSSEPIIIVGPGTGIAPFRAFWQDLTFKSKHLQNGLKKHLPEVSLYTGCRNPQEDFLFQEEIRKAHKAGIITHVHCAFSRIKGRQKVCRTYWCLAIWTLFVPRLLTRKTMFTLKKLLTLKCWSLTHQCDPSFCRKFNSLSFWLHWLLLISKKGQILRFQLQLLIALLKYFQILEKKDQCLTMKMNHNLFLF